MKKIPKGSKAGIVCCSNGQQRRYENEVKLLGNTLQKLGLQPVFSPFIYEKEQVFSGTGRERAESLMEFYRDHEIAVIFDISGGDIANEVLPFLDFSLIGESEKNFWGYSDLTTIINSIYAKTGKSSVLYQVRNLIYQEKEVQQADFLDTVLGDGKKLFEFQYEFVQHKEMGGVVVGGNIRCLLKLAGTPYWPDMKGKILLLESLGGTIPQMVTYLNQLAQIGALEEINGLILGTFTKLEEEGQKPGIVDLARQYVKDGLPIVKTQKIGHGEDAKGIVIGEEIVL
ncbi:MAG: LD-carboxypeptidase [Lachnospiraceae bacterium]|nr:LD-carboxypeptidase [Lachnospiraceae bacterium]